MIFFTNSIVPEFLVLFKIRTLRSGMWGVGMKGFVCCSTHFKFISLRSATMLATLCGGNIYYFWFYSDFSLEGGGTLPQNSYKPSRDLWEATLLRRTRSVQRLARSFGTDTQTDKQTSCYFSIRIKWEFLSIFSHTSLVLLVFLDELWKRAYWFVFLLIFFPNYFSFKFI